jgi:hypothetical protein
MMNAPKASNAEVLRIKRGVLDKATVWFHLVVRQHNEDSSTTPQSTIKPANVQDRKTKSRRHK